MKVIGEVNTDIYDGNGYQNINTSVTNTSYETTIFDLTIAGAGAIHFRINGLGAGEIVWCEFFSVQKITGLVAAYNMIPSAGNVLVDISGEGDEGTINGCFIRWQEE